MERPPGMEGLPCPLGRNVGTPSLPRQRASSGTWPQGKDAKGHRGFYVAKLRRCAWTVASISLKRVQAFHSKASL